MKAKLLSSILAASLLCTHLSFGQAPSAPAAGRRIDRSLYTTYSLFGNDTSINWSVCGSTQNTFGCFASGSLGPFGKVGALLEGNPTTDVATSTVTRSIYVVDIASGASQDAVVLSVYTKTDMITPDFDTVTVTLSRTVTLPLMGGVSAAASMAANSRFLFIGTNRSAQGVELDKGTLTPILVGGFSPPINVSAITADQYGYVAITFGSFNGGNAGFLLYGPDGNLQEDGGGAEFTVGTMQAVLPSALH